MGDLHWQWDAGGHAEVSLGHSRRNRFLGPPWPPPPLLLVFFGKRGGLCFFPGFPLLLVLHFMGAVSSQEVILLETERKPHELQVESFHLCLPFQIFLFQTNQKKASQIMKPKDKLYSLSNSWKKMKTTATFKPNYKQIQSYYIHTNKFS